MKVDHQRLCAVLKFDFVQFVPEAWVNGPALSFFVNFFSDLVFVPVSIGRYQIRFQCEGTDVVSNIRPFTSVIVVVSDMSDVD